MNKKTVEACARAAHEVNRAYCLAIGDDSQPSWDDAPAWQKISAYKGVEVVYSGGGPEESHASWLKEKIETGWTLGPVKDPEKKEHPCMVAYGDLPEAQRKKDGLFVGTVIDMLTALGEKGS